MRRASVRASVPPFLCLPRGRPPAGRRPAEGWPSASRRSQLWRRWTVRKERLCQRELMKPKYLAYDSYLSMKHRLGNLPILTISFSRFIISSKICIKENVSSKMATKPFKIDPFGMSLRLFFFVRVCSEGTSPRG